MAGEQWQYTYAPSAGAAIRYDVFSGEVSLGHHDGGASAYGSSGGGTEYRDVSTVGSAGGSVFQHFLSSVESPRGETTQFIRGSNGRIERVVYPDGGQKTIAYDRFSMPQHVSLPQGTLLTYTHDEHRREIGRTSSQGETRSFGYTTGDRLAVMTDASGTTFYDYDGPGGAMDEVFREQNNGVEMGIEFEHDVLGRVELVEMETTGTEDVTTQYIYDENGNLFQVIDPLGGITEYEYDEVDRLVERTLPNGVVTTYGYDDRDRVLSVVHTGPSGVLARTTYLRNPSGEPYRITREDNSYVVLTYDDALRIESETYYNSSNTLLDAIEYEYDDDGNRTSKTSTAGGFESYTYEPGFKLAHITRGTTTETFDYDAGGRLVLIARDGVERTLEYNSDDKLTRVVDGTTERAKYTYDGAGRRIASEIAGVARYYNVAPSMGTGYDSVQMVLDENSDTVASYVYAGEHPIARVMASGTIEYYLQDAMGSVIGMASASGASTATIKYDSFGQVTSAVGASAGIDSAIGTDFRYHGMLLDAATGLYHVRARTYDARTGRFTSRDPVAGFRRSPESMNPYTFNRNSPQLWIDPSGKMTVLATSLVRIVVGILALTAAATFAAMLSEPIDDPDSQEALERARTSGGPGSFLCGLRAFDWSLADQREATGMWLGEQTAGATNADYIFSREWDAFGHCWSACNLCRKCGQDGAWLLSDLFEDARDLGFSPWVGPPWIGPHDSSSQDRNNHSIGIAVAASPGSCGENCGQARLDLSAPPGAYAWDIAQQIMVPSSEVPPL